VSRAIANGSGNQGFSPAVIRVQRAITALAGFAEQRPATESIQEIATRVCLFAWIQGASMSSPSSAR
jgi:hypothetical protein